MPHVWDRTITAPCKMAVDKLPLQRVKAKGRCLSLLMDLHQQEKLLRLLAQRLRLEKLCKLLTSGIP